VARIVRKQIDSEAKEAYFLPQVREFRRHVGVPLICVGGMRSLGVMESAVESGGADLVALCRPLIREPDLPRKLRDGTASRAACVSCNGCTRGPDGRLGCVLDMEVGDDGGPA
jgi:2,4-dienoyl-CoA reductase-like NADH-dependent reductase (Old Yellow Enzyme family)